MKNYLTGPRVKLVKFTERHITPRYVEWLNDHQVNRYLCSGRIPISKEELGSRNSHDNLFFAIMSNLIPDTEGLTATEEYQNYVGTCSLNKISWIDRHAEIGILLGEQSHWGQGIATEVIGLLTDYSFDRLNIHKLTAGVVEENVGSYKAFEKNGFQRYATEIQDYYLEGKYLDTYRYYRLKDV